MIAAVVILFVGLGLLGLFVVALEATNKLVEAARERTRLRRVAQEASWRIHCQATEAFDQLLQAAREAEREDRS